MDCGDSHEPREVCVHNASVSPLHKNTLGKVACEALFNLSVKRKFFKELPYLVRRMYIVCSKAVHVNGPIVAHPV
jgi:hypothetical protein